MNSPRTYYQILFVHADAPKEIIKSSYRTLMQQLNAHPDRGGDAEEAALINKAYNVLSDEEKRKEYDLQISQPGQPASPAPDISRRETVRLKVGPICPFCSSEHPHKKNIPDDAICVICESPLSFAKKGSSGKSGQRKIQRISKISELNYYLQWPQSQPHTGLTVDISPRGMMFETSGEIPVDSIIKIDCSRFNAVAHVVNCREAGKFLRPNWQIGVQFVTLQYKSSRGTFISDTA